MGSIVAQVFTVKIYALAAQLGMTLKLPLAHTSSGMLASA
jgi:hypothetical protein